MYSCLTELFEKELVICIKMNLALNNQQRLICHKIQTTNSSLSSKQSFDVGLSRGEELNLTFKCNTIFFF